MKRVVEDRECCIDCEFASCREVRTPDKVYWDWKCTIQNGRLIFTETRANRDSFPSCELGLFEERS